MKISESNKRSIENIENDVSLLLQNASSIPVDDIQQLFQKILKQLYFQKTKINMPFQWASFKTGVSKNAFSNSKYLVSTKKRMTTVLVFTRFY